MPQFYTPPLKHHLIITHIMWYEIELVEEYLASLTQAVLNAKWPIRLNFMINAQTYLEAPDDNSNALELALQIQTMILTHPFNIWSSTQEILTDIKTDEEPFYNIGDYRRDTFNTGTGYTVWGETDALYPKRYFQLLEIIATEDFKDPYVVSLASRKCWDTTWNIVEHSRFQPLEPTTKGQKKLKAPFNWDDYITQQELDDFNDEQTKAPPLLELPVIKFDGALLALSGGMPQLIPGDQHFGPDDWAAQMTLQCIYPNIKQYHLPTVLKGHNYMHPRKRLHTDSTREDLRYKQEVNNSMLAIKRWLNNHGVEFRDGQFIRSIDYVG